MAIEVNRRYLWTSQMVDLSGREAYNRSLHQFIQQRKENQMQIRALTILTSLTLVTATTNAADDSMVGKWKFNPDKSQLNGLPYKIDDVGGGKYKFTFGEDSETLTLDGKEHTTKFGNVWTIKPAGPNSWDFTVKRDGKVAAKAKWTISEDGTFTSTEEAMRPDGSTGTTESTLKRDGGGSGLVGDWQSTSTKITSPLTIEIAKSKGEGYSLINPSYKEHLDFKFDDKEHTPVGPRVPKGLTATAKKVDDHTVELTYKLKGKTTETDKWELSADGKNLTNTVTFAGITKPEVDVYDRQ